MKNLITVLLLVLINSIFCFPQNDFRNVKWGMSKSQVMELETSPLKYDVEPGDDAIYYSAIIQNYSVCLYYSFFNYKLNFALYDFEIKHDDKTDYIGDYDQIKELLIKKYGKPPVDTIEWVDTTYKDSPKEYGNAIFKGHLKYEAMWFGINDRTNITLQLFAKNSKMTIYTSYSRMKSIIKANDEL
jgi:hypothetical protein